jgi:hypothetical protein
MIFLFALTLSVWLHHLRSLNFYSFFCAEPNLTSNGFYGLVSMLKAWKWK